MTEVIIPPELSQALQTRPELHTLFMSLAPSHQREYIKYITQAKQAETRARRVATTLDMLRVKYERSTA